MIFDTDDVLKRAIRMRGAKRGESLSEVLNALLRELLAEEIAEIERHDRKAKKKEEGR